MAAASTSTSVSLKEYLKRYEAGTEKHTKKKKKAKSTKPSSAGGVLIVDEDPTWQKPVKPEEEDEDSAGEEKPVVDEDIEVKRLKRLEQLRSRKPYLAISDDGSGWVSVSDTLKRANSAGEAPDLSPRQRRARFNTPSPDREPKPLDSGNPNLSPPSQRRRHYHSQSPDPKLKPSNSGDHADMSPPQRRRLDEDLSPPRRVRPHSPELETSRGAHADDLSPPRRSKKDSSEDLSFLRRSKMDLWEDFSPLRRSKMDSSEDLSPLRRSRKGLSEDLSPPRWSRHRSPVAVRLQESKAVDPSPPGRSKRGSVEDLSPPRRGRNRSLEADLSSPRESRKKLPSAKEEPRAGLFTGREIKEDIDRKKKEERSRFAALDPILSGRGAEPVFRDKEGKRISKEEMLKLQKGEEKPKEKKLEWGKGLAQKREAEAKVADLELEKDKPFARTRDDPELDKMLKERIRWGDPMAHLVKRKHSEPALEDFGDDEKMKESGFIIPQTIPSHSWIKRGIDPPPNRYGIRPGRHWDGVDRSSGYEKEMFKRQNEKRATETEAYLWSVSEM